MVVLAEAAARSVVGVQAEAVARSVVGMQAEAAARSGGEAVELGCINGTSKLDCFASLSLF